MGKVPLETYVLVPLTPPYPTFKKVSLQSGKQKPCWRAPGNTNAKAKTRRLAPLGHGILGHKLHVPLRLKASEGNDILQKAILEKGRGFDNGLNMQTFD